MSRHRRDFVLSGYFCGMSISIATEADLPQLFALVNSAYRGEEAKKGWTHEADLIEGTLRTDEADLKELMLNPNGVILLYKEDDEVTGCVYLEKNGTKLYLGMLSVLPTKQDAGIGKKLLLAAEDHARKVKCHFIEMTVISARKELIDWYGRYGYKDTGEKRPFHVETKFGIPRQAIEFMVMQKELNYVL